MALAVSLQGIKCLILVRRSLITKMVSKHSMVRRSVTKSMETSSQERSGTGRGWRLPKGKCRTGLSCGQVRQL